MDSKRESSKSQDKRQKKFSHLLKVEQLQREPSQRDFNPLDPPDNLFSPPEKSKNKNNLYADPVKFLYNVWGLPYSENIPDDTDLYGFLLAIKNGNVKCQSKITAREDLPGKVHTFIESFNDCNISYSPFLTNQPNFKKESFYKTKAFVIDLDLYKSNREINKERVFEKLERFKIGKPHYIVHSSDEGRQLVWLTYLEDVENRPNLTRNIRELQDKFTKQVFPFADNLKAENHLFRLPGTFNQKENRNNFHVCYEQVEDPQVPYGFYSDLYNPLYKVPNLTSKELKDKKKNYTYEHPEDPLNHPVIKQYKSKLRNYSGYTPGELLNGLILALKATGKNKGEIKAIVRKWIDDKYLEHLEDSLNWAFSGTGADGQINGHGWNHKIAGKHLNLENYVLKDFYNYVSNPKKTPAPETSYLSLRERKARYIAFALGNLEKHKAISFKDFSEEIDVPESSIRRDIKDGNLPGFLVVKVRHGQITKWYFVTTETVNSAKMLFYNAYVVRGRENLIDRTLTRKEKNKKKANFNLKPGKL